MYLKVHPLIPSLSRFLDRAILKEPEGRATESSLFRIKLKRPPVGGYAKMKNLALSGYGLYRNGASHLQPFFLLFVRVYWGCQFVQTGLGKLGWNPSCDRLFCTIRPSSRRLVASHGRAEFESLAQPWRYAIRVGCQFRQRATRILAGRDWNSTPRVFRSPQLRVRFECCIVWRRLPLQACACHARQLRTIRTQVFALG